MDTPNRPDFQDDSTPQTGSAKVIFVSLAAAIAIMATAGLAILATAAKGTVASQASRPDPIPDPPVAAPAAPVAVAVPPVVAQVAATPLDRDAAAAIVKDFEQDFELASRKYQDKEWSFTAKVETVEGRHVAVFPDFTLSTVIELANDDEPIKLVRGKSYRFTGVIVPIHAEKIPDNLAGRVYSLRGASTAAQRAAAKGVETTLEWKFAKGRAAEPGR